MTNTSKFSNKQSLLIAALSFTIMWLLAVTVGVCWETNDDPAIARTLAQDAYYCIFVGKILSAFVHSLYRFFPNCLFNWWLGFSVLSVSIGICSLIYVTLQKYPKKLALFISSAIFVTGWFFGIAKMNFTRTSMAISMGGVALISFALRDSKKNSKLVLWLVGLFFMLLGREIRRDSAYIALGFLAVNGLIFLLQQNDILSKAWLCRNISAVILLVISACFIFAGSIVNNFLTSEKEKSAASFQASRSNVLDYSDLYPDYATYSKEYQSSGFSKNDWELFARWTDGDPDYFTYERLHQVGKLRMKGNVTGGVEKVYTSLLTQPLGTLVLLLSVIVLFINTKKNYLPIVCSTMYVLLVFTILVCMGRIIARVTDSTYWGVLVTLLLSADYSSNKEGRLTFIKTLSVSSFIVWMAISILYINPRQLISPFTEDHKKNIKAEQTEAFDYIDSHSNNLYFLAIADGGISLNELYVWKSVPLDYCHNLISLGGWNSRLPCATNLWNENGITNPLQALLYDDNAYLFNKSDCFTSADLILAYFREHYSTSAQMRTVDTVGNFSIVEYYIE